MWANICLEGEGSFEIATASAFYFVNRKYFHFSDCSLDIRIWKLDEAVLLPHWWQKLLALLYFSHLFLRWPGMFSLHLMFANFLVLPIFEEEWFSRILGKFFSSAWESIQMINFWIDSNSNNFFNSDLFCWHKKAKNDIDRIIHQENRHSSYWINQWKLMVSSNE